VPAKAVHRTRRPVESGRDVLAWCSRRSLGRGEERRDGRGGGRAHVIIEHGDVFQLLTPTFTS